ncbi:unnamed protein product [Fusarium venenatum]|uniref:Uncharacterized protein n=1 Tax=Fusarium venenatum TaxID=56646 RepID=A0A2L2U1G8_9HYPO|nr:uncharacterized protein FVRRES_07982 [Fusarium venenatum]CEI67905.1 unnamed protein product [Fusarium venenatum]
MSPRATPAVAWRAVRTTFTVIFSPWYLSHRSMVQLLNSADSDNNSETGTQLSTRDTMTGWWIERKIAELSFVGLTCALLAGVVAAAFSWQDLKDLSWPTKGLWYGSLIIDLTSICLATQQSLTLHRLSCYTNKCERVREMLSKSSSYQAHPSEAEVTQLDTNYYRFVIYLVTSRCQEMVHRSELSIISLVRRNGYYIWDYLSELEGVNPFVPRIYY